MLLLCTAIFSASSHASSDLTNLSLEQLMNEPITSVSKKATKLSEAPAAIAVITQDEIRRFGVTSLPEALRMVPGLDVARISSNAWAVSARGFNGEYSKEMLVLIDGRVVYSPVTAGVHWNAEDVMIEDVDRIEVVRGSGATLWGTNAVNGVINIITKSAKATQGGLISTAASSDGDTQLAARYGSALGPDLQFRIYAKYLDQSGFRDSLDTFDTGSWRTARAGFRADWNSTAVDAVTLQGDIYSGHVGTTVSEVSLAPPSAMPVVNVEVDNGANVLGRWTHKYSTESSLTLQTYLDHVNQGDGADIEHHDTYDVDLQRQFRWASFNDVIFGTGFRYTSVDDEFHSFNLSFAPPHRTISVYNAFLQDEIAIVPDRVRLTLGSKIERDNLSGWSIEPNVRILWLATERQKVWAAISRATRTPSLFELSATANLDAYQTGPTAPPVLVSIIPNSQLRPEDILTYELGYRYVPREQVTMGITAFAARYLHDIVQLPTAPELQNSYGVPHLLVGVLTQNGSAIWSYGAEMSVRWQVVARWQLLWRYTWLRVDSPAAPYVEEESPRHQAQARSLLDLTSHFQLNAALYYVDAVTALGASVPAYVRADIGVVWNPSSRLSIGIWGQNLLQRQHVEYPSVSSGVLSEIPRSALGKVTWGF
jgi:iron complex outermembrane recepter protein